MPEKIKFSITEIIDGKDQSFLWSAKKGPLNVILLTGRERKLDADLIWNYLLNKYFCNGSILQNIEEFPFYDLREPLVIRSKKIPIIPYSQTLHIFYYPYNKDQIKEILPDNYYSIDLDSIELVPYRFIRK